MSKDKLNVRVYHIEQINAVQSFVRDREVVFFERYSPDTALALHNLLNTQATGVNFLRATKLGWRARRAEQQLFKNAKDLGKADDFLKARVLDNANYQYVETLCNLLPSYQSPAAFDMTPPGGVGVICCRLPYSPNRADRTPEVQRVIDQSIAIWESLNDINPADQARGLILLFS